MRPMSEPLVLREIHLPEAVGGWPPAPGWLLSAALLLALLWLVIRLRRHWRAGALRRAVRREFKGLRKAWRASGDDQALLRGLSALLRRVAITTAPRESVAGLQGEAWLAFLDAGLPERRRGGFTEGVGRVLADGPYRPDATLDAKPLLKLTRVWLERTTHPRRRRP